MDRRDSPSKRGYGRRWQAARATFLKKHPICVKCPKHRPRSATVVDHIVPHKGDQKLFWDQTNWQPLCATCHSAIKQAEERNGYVMGCDANGIPLDPNHHWNH
ncbi:MAG: HNH endonuclease [Rickettsiales bacterium]|nr:HNH endonuclease [Rickettsiales bacterium]|tara:strand:- start:1067 stop:1375 length:309 start_codon:yes stop_codon:yes gene_type:complete